MNDATAWSSLLDPPYSRELLADLHAGALDEGLTAALWPRVRADHDATRVLTALDSTVRQLSAAPPASVAMPAHLAARMDAALAGLVAPPARVSDLAAARASRHGGRRRGVYVGAALVAAAAVAGVVALGSVLGSHSVSGTPQAAAPQAVPAPQAGPPPQVLDLGSGTPGPQALAALGRQDYGSLSVNTTLPGCLQANGVPPATTVIGAAPVTLDGRRGILLLFPTGRAAVFTALVVGPECSAQNPATLSRVDIGPR